MFELDRFHLLKMSEKKHKATKKESRKRSLRTELTRLSSSAIEGH